MSNQFKDGDEVIIRNEENMSHGLKGIVRKTSTDRWRPRRYEEVPTSEVVEVFRDGRTLFLRRFNINSLQKVLVSHRRLYMVIMPAPVAQSSAVIEKAEQTGDLSELITDINTGDLVSRIFYATSIEFKEMIRPMLHATQPVYYIVDNELHKATLDLALTG